MFRLSRCGEKTKLGCCEFAMPCSQRLLCKLDLPGHRAASQCNLVITTSARRQTDVIVSSHRQCLITRLPPGKVSPGRQFTGNNPPRRGETDFYR